MATIAQRQAVVSLATDHEAHIVLADASKAPCWLEDGPYSWPRRRPSSDVILAHGARFGIVPWSIRTTGLDVDQGDPLQLSLFVQPLVTLGTQRGFHLYAPDTQGRPNGHFELHGCRGDIRGDRGYLILHRDGAERLLDAVRRRDDWTPRNLFELVGLPSITLRPERPTRQRVSSAPVSSITLTLAEAIPGCRRNVLHRYLIDTAGRTNRPRRWPSGPVDVPAWNALIRDIAFEALKLMPQPRLPEREVTRLAYSVSTWAASGGRADHSPETQRWRGRRSGAVRFEGSHEQARPWEAEGVSRRTWYARRAEARRIRELTRVALEPVRVGGASGRAVPAVASARSQRLRIVVRARLRQPDGTIREHRQETISEMQVA